MKKILTLLFMILLLTGCNTKPAPTWIAAGHKHLEAFKQNFLAGSATDITENHFMNAVEEIKKGGDIDYLGKVWLTRMALQIAVLREPDENDYLKIDAVEEVPANRNYYRFLMGSADAVDALLLPESYRPFWAALCNRDATKATSAIIAINDPFSRMIASGLAVHQRLETEAILLIAVETSSRNGWKMALLAWLEHLKCFHEAAGDPEKASAIQSRIGLMLSN